VDATPAPDSGLHVLWARSRIETLSDAIREARHTAKPQDELRGQVVRLALDHHLVSAYTSLVAVDLTPVRPAEAPLHQADVPANLPAGWDREALLGQAQRDRSARSSPPPAFGIVADVVQAGPVLARTATPAPLQLAIGLALLATGFLLLLSRRGSRLLAAGPTGAGEGR
jgi:Ca-activated chloride channel family protein